MVGQIKEKVLQQIIITQWLPSCRLTSEQCLTNVRRQSPSGSICVFCVVCLIFKQVLLIKMV